MKWKDSFDRKGVNGETEEDFLDEETYSPWKKKSPGDVLAKWLGNSMAPYILAAVGVLILVVGLWAVFSSFSGGSGAEKGRLEALEQRLGQLERKLDDQEGILASVTRIDALEKKSDQLKGRFDRMEAALALRMDHLSKKLDGLPARPAARRPARPAPTPAVKPADSQPKTPPAPDTAIRFHVVKKGETLYGISRQYGISVADLQRLNTLSGTAIKIGQKLRLGAAAN